MTHLNTLAFVTVPKRSSLSPVIGRRNRLIYRLEEQKRLAADPSFIPVSKRWKKTPDGSKTQPSNTHILWSRPPQGTWVESIRLWTKRRRTSPQRTAVARAALT